MSDETISVQIVSAVGVDYSNLQQLLAAGKWREADEETAKVMCEIAKREEGWLDKEDVENLPAEDLCTIDQLWVNYSDGRFGFSVQKHIWESLGGKPGKCYPHIYELFADRVGWYVTEKHNWKTSYDDLTFSLDAPVGHLPALYCLPEDLAERLWALVEQLHWGGIMWSVLSRRDL